MEINSGDLRSRRSEIIAQKGSQKPIETVNHPYRKGYTHQVLIRESQMKTPDHNVRRILMVEDEPAICKVCSLVLASEGYEVDIAANGRIAEDMIKESHYDLCLIDLRTPVMSGMDLYQWLNSTHPEQAARVIFTTGDVLGGDIKSFLEDSGRLFLPKPFTPDELKAVVREALQQLQEGY